jgi:hypothetical protein
LGCRPAPQGFHAGQAAAVHRAEHRVRPVGLPLRRSGSVVRARLTMHPDECVHLPQRWYDHEVPDASPSDLQLCLQHGQPEHECPGGLVQPVSRMKRGRPVLKGSLGETCFEPGRSVTGRANSGVNIDGVFARAAWAARFSDITDGTSHVIMMGEILPSCGDHHRGGWYNDNALWTATTAHQLQHLPQAEHSRQRP